METKDKKEKEHADKAAESVRPAGGHNTRPKPPHAHPEGDTDDRKEQRQAAHASPATAPQPEDQDSALSAVTGVMEDAFGSGAQNRYSQDVHSPRPAEGDVATPVSPPGKTARGGERYLDLDANRASGEEPDSVGGSMRGDFAHEGNSIDGPAKRPRPMPPVPQEAGNENAKPAK